MSKPFIALSSRSRIDPNTNRIFYDNESYYEFIRLGGGIASVVHAANEEDAKEIAEKFDGLLLTGGEDPSLEFLTIIFQKYRFNKRVKSVDEFYTFFCFLLA